MQPKLNQDCQVVDDSAANSRSSGLKNVQMKDVKTDKTSHLKKEKSRDAARSRRGKENFEFYELAKLLPIPEETSSLLDKASIVRLTMSFLQLHKFFHVGSCFLSSYQHIRPPDHDTPRYSRNYHLSMLSQCLDGFLIVISKDGRCLYVSDTINSYLGLPQVDLVGSNMSNFIHPADYSDLQERLKNSSDEDSKPRSCQTSNHDEKDMESFGCSMLIRMKSTLARRGLNVKSTGFKVVHVLGRVCCKTPSSPKEDESSSDEEDSSDPTLGFVGIVQVLPPPLVDIRLDGSMFVTRLDLSLRVLYCEDRIKELANYDAEELKGCTVYQFVHNADLDKICKCHVDILTKGQVVTPYYRWLLKNGSYIWVQSSVALLQDKHQTTEEDSFVWITYVVCHGKDKLPTCDVAAEEFPGRASMRGPETVSYREKYVQHEEGGTSSTKRRNVEDIHAMEEDEPLPVIPKEPSVAPKPSKAETYFDPAVKPVKQTPEKFSKLKRIYSADVSNDKTKIDADSSTTSLKRERRDRCFSETAKMSPFSTAGLSTDSALPCRSKAGDVLDVDSTMWGNPPNREVSNQSDLNTTVMHHHYPYGIDPTLLNSNPVFAKMLTTNYVSYEPLLTHRDAFLLAPPTFFTPVLNTLPHLVPAPPGKVAYCPPSVATIIEELRKDPMRKKNPPNKVVLSCARIPQAEALANGNDVGCSTPSASQNNLVTALPPPLLSLSDGGGAGLFLAPLGSYQAQGANGPIILQPVKLAHGVNAFNSLPI